MKRFLKFTGHPFMHLLYCFGLSILSVHLWKRQLEWLEYILLAIIFSLFAVGAFLDAVIGSLNWWLEKSDG